MLAHVTDEVPQNDETNKCSKPGVFRGMVLQGGNKYRRFYNDSAETMLLWHNW